MFIAKVSKFTGKINTMDLDITQKQLDRWRPVSGVGGELIQVVFPKLTASEREFLMTGTTQAEWDAAFPPEEDDE